MCRRINKQALGVGIQSLDRWFIVYANTTCNKLHEITIYCPFRPFPSDEKSDAYFRHFGLLCFCFGPPRVIRYIFSVLYEMNADEESRRHQILLFGENRFAGIWWRRLFLFSALLTGAMEKMWRCYQIPLLIGADRRLFAFMERNFARISIGRTR